MQERVLEFAEALGVVLREAAGVGAPRVAESVGLLEAAGRVLAEAVMADRDQPPFDRATRDGFAVSLKPTSQKRDVGHPEYRVLGQVRAGAQWSGAALQAGEAVEIMTGAPVPESADAVVMVEHTSVTDGLMRIEAGRVMRQGENVVPRGAEAWQGASLLPVGRVMGAAEIAVAASCGCARVQVFAKPKVAIVATGDELVELGGDRTGAGEADPPPMAKDDKAKGELGEAEIYNSNSYALAALVAGAGGEAVRLAVARDTMGDLRERLEEARGAEILLLSGGVSMGKYDLVEQALAEAGAEFFFTGAKIQPGKPVVFGRLPRKAGAKALFLDECRQGPEGPFSLRETIGPQAEWVYFFGLPGNPVSTQVCFALFVAPLLRAMSGRTEVAPVFVEAKLAEEVKGGAKVTRFLPAELVGAWDGVTVRVVGWHGSGDVAANARGNGYCVLPSGVEGFAKGDVVRVLLR